MEPIETLHEVIQMNRSRSTRAAENYLKMINSFYSQCRYLVRMTLFVALCLLYSFVAVSAQESPIPYGAPPASLGDAPRRFPRRDEQGRALVRQLDLNAEQISQLREIRRQSTIERRAVTARLRQAQRALDAAIFAEGADESSVESRVKRVAELQRDVIRLRAFTELKIRRLLTPQQLQTLRAMRERALLRRADDRRNRKDGSNIPDASRPPNP